MRKMPYPTCHTFRVRSGFRRCRLLPFAARRCGEVGGKRERPCSDDVSPYKPRDCGMGRIPVLRPRIPGRCRASLAPIPRQFPRCPPDPGEAIEVPIACLRATRHFPTSGSNGKADCRNRPPGTVVPQVALCVSSLYCRERSRGVSGECSPILPVFPVHFGITLPLGPAIPFDR